MVVTTRRRLNNVRRQVVTRVARASRRINNDFVTNFTNDIVRAVSNTLSDTTFIIFTALVGWLFYQHESPDNPIFVALARHNGHPLANWVKGNLDKVIGASFFVPFLIKMRSKTVVYTLAIAISVAILVLPTLHLWAYAVFSAVIFLYNSCNRKSTRIVLLCASAATAYYLVFYSGWAIYKPVVMVPSGPLGSTVNRSPPTFFPSMGAGPSEPVDLKVDLPPPNKATIKG